MISFLEELIHHFIHPHKKTAKFKIHRQCGRKELNQRNEFELYDQNWRNANKIVPSIDATNITCSEEGLYFGVLVLKPGQQGAHLAHQIVDDFHKL